MRVRLLPRWAALGGQGSRRSGIDAFLPVWNIPRPLKFVVAAVVWPVFAVTLLVGGAAGIVLALMALVLVACIVIVAVAGGLDGGSYLVQHPGAVVPHAVATTAALLVALPLSIWWARDVLSRWRVEDEQRRRGEELEAARWAVDEPEGWLPKQFDTPLFRQRAASIVQNYEPVPMPQPPSRLAKLGASARNAVACAAWLVFLWTLGSSLHQVAANDPAAGVLVVAVVALIGATAYFSLVKRFGDDKQTWIGSPIAVLLVALAIGTFVGINERASGKLRRYCEYGVVSRAQLAGCLDHVTDSQIDRLQTDAARFARGDLWQCLSDAGPFCASRLAKMQADQNESDGQ
jgi:hypothetical protein